MSNLAQNALNDVRFIVIKLGGSVMEDPVALHYRVMDIAAMATLGMRPVVVHGGGAAITRAMQHAGIEPRFIQGRRYTDRATRDIVESVLAYEINESLADHVNRCGGSAISLNFRTTNVLFGAPLGLIDLDGSAIDLGYVGQVNRVDRAAIEACCNAGQVPVIPSMCRSDDGEKLNVNADTAATAVAQALNAERLLCLSDVNGVRRDKDDPRSLIRSLTDQEARLLISNGAVAAGMIPKLEACLETLESGVGKVHIVDGRARHSLLQGEDLHAEYAIGTEILRTERQVA